MSDSLTECDLTRLSYLITTLVARPANVKRCIKIVASSPRSPALSDVLTELSHKAELFDVSSRDALYSVAASMKQNDNKNIKRVGILLFEVLEEWKK